VSQIEASGDQVREAVHRVQVEDACNLHFPCSAANPLTLMRAWWSDAPSIWSPLVIGARSSRRRTNLGKNGATV
jgi:hypothetical protein